MLGRTHVMTGIAASLVILHPTTISGIVGAVAGGTLGGAMCDLDTRKAQLGDGKISGLELAVLLVFGTAVADFVFKAGVYGYIFNHMNSEMMMALLLFFGGGIVGFFSPHRSIMHSIVAAAYFTVLMQRICLPVAPAFMIGFLSHLALDLLNKKGMLLFFPFKWRICLNLVPSDGAFNKNMAKISTFVSTVMIVALVACTILGKDFPRFRIFF